MSQVNLHGCSYFSSNLERFLEHAATLSPVSEAGGLGRHSWSVGELRFSDAVVSSLSEMDFQNDIISTLHWIRGRTSPRGWEGRARRPPARLSGTVGGGGGGHRSSGPRKGRLRTGFQALLL